MKKRRITALCMTVVLIGSLLFQSYAKEQEDKKTHYTFSDYGFASVETVKGTETGSDVLKYNGIGETLHGITIEGYLNIGAGTQDNKIYYGAGEWNWNGFIISNADSRSIQFMYYADSGEGTLETGLTNNILDPDTYNANNGTAPDVTTLIGTDLKVKVTFSYADPTAKNSNITISLTINDAYEATFSVKNARVSELVNNISIGSGQNANSITAKSCYTPEYFGFDATHTFAPGTSQLSVERTDSMDGYIIEGYYNFDAGTQSSRVTFGSRKGVFCGFFIENYDSRSIRFGYAADGDADTVFESGLEGNILTPEIYNSDNTGTQLSSLIGNDLKIKAEFTYEGDSQVSIQLTINDTYRNTFMLSGSSVQDKLKGNMGAYSAAGQGAVLTVRTEKMVKKYSFDDFGFAEVLKPGDGGRKKSLDNSNLLNSEFEGYMNFSTTSECSQIFFGAQEYAWTGFAVRNAPEGDGTLRVLFSTGAVETELGIITVEDYNANNGAGVDYVSLVGNDLKVNVKFWAHDMKTSSTETDLYMKLTLNDCYTKTYVMNSVLRGYFDKYLGVILPSGATNSTYRVNKYETYSFSDFGYQDVEQIAIGTVAGHETLGTDLNNMIFEGYVNIGAGTEDNRIWFGNRYYGGLCLENRDSQTIRFWYYDADDNTVQCVTDVTPSVYNAANGNGKDVTRLIGEDVKLKLTFTYDDMRAAKTTLHVQVTLNDCYTMTMDITNINPKKPQRRVTSSVYGSAANSMTVKSVYHHAEDLKELSLDSFGITAAPVYEKGVSKSCESAWDKTRFTAEISLPEKGSNASFVIGGLHFMVPEEGNNYDLILANAKSDTATYYAPLSAQKAGVGSFENTKLRIAVETEYQDNDVILTIYFNEKQYDNRVFIIKDFAASMGTSLSFYGGTENPIRFALPQVNLTDDIGIVEKEYDNRFYAYGHYSKYVDGENLYIDGTLMDTSLTQKITFSNTPDLWINYAGLKDNSGDGSWKGIRFTTLSDGRIYVSAAAGEFTETYSITAEKAGVSALLGTELEWRFELYREGNDAKLELYINDRLYDDAPFVFENAADKLGGYLGFYVGNTDGTIKLGSEEASFVDATEYYNLADGYYLVAGKGKVTINYGDYQQQIDNSGDYFIYADGGRPKTEGRYAKEVVLFRCGDAHPDDILDVRDLVAAKKQTAGIAPKTKAGKKGCDANGDGAVNLSDLIDIKQDLIRENKSLLNQKTQNYTFDADVMPIGGHIGSFRTTTPDATGSIYDTITPDVYQKIQELGVNFIILNNESVGDGFTPSKLVIENLALAEQYNIDMLVRDLRSQTTVSELVELRKQFAEYSSFRGYVVMDEPYTEAYHPTDWTEDILNQQDLMGRYLNHNNMIHQFANGISYVNLLPGLAHLTPEEDYMAVYAEYVDSYIETYNPKVLSYDFYQYSQKDGDVESLRKKFFENILLIREKAQKAGIPFWTHVQAGNDFNKYVYFMMPDVRNTSPSRGEMLWDINTALACGAKGIQYFPIVQPDFFSYTEGNKNDFTRNGLLGADGSINVWYGYAQTANQQIAEIDEILMNAASEEILAIGSELQEQSGITKTVDSKGLLESVSAPKGALIGVFDYRGQTAFYVVNDSVTEEQTISLNFKEVQNIDVNTNQGAVSGTSITLDAGGAALVLVN